MFTFGRYGCSRSPEYATLKTQHRESSFSYTTTSGVPYVINQTECIHGEVVHIFTGDTLMFLMNQVDTTQDFVGYLKERENVFKNGSDLFVSKESDLVHMYYKAEQG